MTAPTRRGVRTDLRRRLDAYEATEGTPPGLTPDRRDSLIEQLVDSVRRNQFVDYLTRAELSDSVTDPSDPAHFDPLRAAVVYHRRGNDDEAFWMLFLFVHFGKSRRRGYEYARAFYGRLGGQPWTWTEVTENLSSLQTWLDNHTEDIKLTGGGFGNHRKREGVGGIGAVVASYVDWVGSPPVHRSRIDSLVTSAGNDPCRAFALLYDSMRAIYRFGRIACFDYLAMAGKLGLADVHPDKAYFQGSSGPRKGAALLFRGADVPTPATALEAEAAKLRDYLNQPFDVIEDALCNWQKSPDRFKPFRG